MIVEVHPVVTLVPIRIPSGYMLFPLIEWHDKDGKNVSEEIFLQHCKESNFTK